MVLSSIQACEDLSEVSFKAKEDVLDHAKKFSGLRSHGSDPGTRQRIPIGIEILQYQLSESCGCTQAR